MFSFRNSDGGSWKLFGADTVTYDLPAGTYINHFVRVWIICTHMNRFYASLAGLVFLSNGPLYADNSTITVENTCPKGRVLLFFFISCSLIPRPISDSDIPFWLCVGLVRDCPLGYDYFPDVNSEGKAGALIRDLMSLRHFRLRFPVCGDIYFT